MIAASTQDAESTGPLFTEDGMLAARRKTREAIESIAAKVRPGMVEEDAVAMARSTLVDAGLSLSWHPTRVRFGRNTTKAMKVASEPGVVLGESDIFFLDIAPRYADWEGDGGKSFVVGDNVDHARCARDAERLFHEARGKWLRNGLTGQQLYAFAQQRAREMGWELNLDLPGHRLSDFPHAAIHTGALADAAHPPAAMRWVLEIHLRDRDGRFGAFYEDLLLEDRHYASAA
jgi:Xaa-Pro aminopeptidase